MTGNEQCLKGKFSMAMKSCCLTDVVKPSCHCLSVLSTSSMDAEPIQFQNQ